MWMFQDEDELLASLLHGNARLEFVLAQYLEAYAAVLKTAKAAKVETAMNRVSSSGRKNNLPFVFLAKPMLLCYYLSLIYFYKITVSTGTFLPYFNSS